MMIETIKLYILISVWVTLTFIQVTVVLEIKTIGFHFLMNFFADLDEIHHVATTCWSVDAHAKFMYASNIQGRDLC